MLSVINPSQIGGPAFPRPINPMANHHHRQVSGSVYSNDTFTKQGGYNKSTSCSVSDCSDFVARGNNAQGNQSVSSALMTSSSTFNTASSTTPEVFYFSSSSKNNSTCTTSSSSSCSVLKDTISQSNSQNNLYTKPWNHSHNIFHPGYRSFSTDQHHLMPHSATTSYWMDGLSSSTPTTETPSSSTSLTYPLANRRMSTNSAMLGYNNIEQCRLQQQLQKEQQNEMEKTRKRLAANNSLFCNPSTSRVTNRSLPQPDGSSSKDFTKQLFVDCSIEYELPNAPKIPKNSAPILMIHSGAMKRACKEDKDDCRITKDNSKVSPNNEAISSKQTMVIKEEGSKDNETNTVRALNSKNGVVEVGKKLCNSSKCSCPEAVQYRKKYQLQLLQQKSIQGLQKQKSSTTTVCDNQFDISLSKCVLPAPLQAGCKRSYAQSMIQSKNPNAEKISRASTQQKEHMISTSAPQHQTTENCDQNSLFGQNRDNSYNNRLPKNYHQRLQQNNSGSSSISEEVEVSSPLSIKTATPCSLDSSSTTFMERLNYLSKGRSASSDELTIASSDQPCSKRSRVSYNNSIHHRQQLEREQRRHHLEFQRRQDVLRKHEEHAAAVVLAQQQHQQREHFLQSMRARQHQHDRQAALSTLAAANLAAYRQQSSAQTQLTRYTPGGDRSSCCWPGYGVSTAQTQATTLSNNSRHQLHQMSSFQQITPPGSMPFCWAPGPAQASHHPSACPPSCCQSSGCCSVIQSGRQQPHGRYRQHEKTSAYGMEIVRSKQAAAATMAAMASCYGSSQHAPTGLVPPPPIPCAATPALTGGNPNAAAAAMAGCYCLGCIQGKCQVNWNKENAVNNKNVGIMRSL